MLTKHHALPQQLQVWFHYQNNNWKSFNSINIHDEHLDLLKETKWTMSGSAKKPQQGPLHMWNVEKLATEEIARETMALYTVCSNLRRFLSLQSRMRYLHELTGFSSTQVIEDDVNNPSQKTYISAQKVVHCHLGTLGSSVLHYQLTNIAPQQWGLHAYWKGSMRNTSQKYCPSSLKASHNMRTQKPPSEQNTKV